MLLITDLTNINNSIIFAPSKTESLNKLLDVDTLFIVVGKPAYWLQYYSLSGL